MLNTDLERVAGTALMTDSMDSLAFNVGGFGFEDVVLLTGQIRGSVGLDPSLRRRLKGLSDRGGQQWKMSSLRPRFVGSKHSSPRRSHTGSPDISPSR